MVKKIAILVTASVLISILWFNGLEKVYGHILVFTTNTIVGIGSSQTAIKVETADNDLVFRVTTIIDGKRGSYPQRAQSLLLPAVIVLSWIPLLFFSLPAKQAAKQGAFDFGLFLLFQVLFMILLTFYYNSELAKYLFHLMMEAFYVFAVIVIIKDSYKYPAIWKTEPPETTI